MVRAIAECLHAVRCNGAVGLSPVTQEPPMELASVPVVDLPRS